MIILIHSLEILLVLLIVALVISVIRAYRAELPSVGGEQAVSPVAADLVQVSIVENYIEDFFNMKSESLNPLLALRAEQEMQTSANLENTRTVQANPAENSQSISSKVIEAMMSEAELLCAS